MNKAILYTILGGMMASASICSAANTVLPNKITSNTTLKTGTDYQINGYTYVMSGATLTIEPGVHVYASEGTGASASALIITRGGKIDAKGTASRPIVFEPVSAQTSELGPDDTGMWGGIIVLGKGVLNSNKAGTWTGSYPTQDVEGMLPASGDETLINFGGSDNADTSGTLSYVSIRHGGVVLSEGNEINGLTLGGVGSGTKIDHIEVFANKDDAIEIFGGAVNLDHVVCAFSYDDSLDLDEGYQGQVQYLFAIQRAIVDNAGTITDQGDKGGEWDGADYPNNGTPEMLVKLANATFIGLGNNVQDSNASAPSAAISNTALNIRANGAAEVYNSVFAGYVKMLQIDATYKNQNGETVSDDSQIARFNDGDIKFGGNVWFSSTEANNTAAGLQVSGSTKLTNDAFFTSNNNQIANPGITISRIAGSHALDVTPASNSASVTGTKATLPSGFEATTYSGAFKSDYNWAVGWTKLSEDGYFTNEGTWFNDPNLGWVWYKNGKIASGCSAYIYDLDSWAWIATDDASGSWMYLYK
jgi:hypothetical protein